MNDHEVFAGDQLERPMPAGGLTTAQKLEQVVGELLTAPLDEMPAKARELIGGIQLMIGMGKFDPMDLLPADPADADTLVDNLIAMLLNLRGDDLPPFDLARHAAGLPG